MQQRRALARAPRGGEEFLLRKVLLRRPLQLGNALIADSLDERCQDFGARAKPIELVGGDMKIFEIARLHIGLLQHLEGIAVIEIGRASCRESVCQYVYISVAAVSLTTQKQNV